MKHKKIVFPHVDISHDEADPDWKGKDFERVPHGKSYRWIRPPGIYKRAWKGRKYIWKKIVRDFESNPDDFCNAWNYLDNHPIYWEFRQSGFEDRPSNHYSRLVSTNGISRCVDLDVVKVNPKNKTIEQNKSRNTETRVWWETGQFDLLPRDYEPGFTGQHHWHDWKMDGGAPTVEEAIIKLAKKIHKKYGNDRRHADKSIRYHEENGNDMTNIKEESLMEWGWNGCTQYCEHGGVCMETLPHDMHHTGTHSFILEGCYCAKYGGCPYDCSTCAACSSSPKEK